MNKKITGILICTLFIIATILPVNGTINKDDFKTSDFQFFEDHDMEITNITSPFNGTVCGEIIPQILVTNLGSQYENVTINMTIEKLTGGTVLEYYQELNDSFDQYQSKFISFPIWIPNAWQTEENVDIEYRVCACVTVIDFTDPDISNNCYCANITLHFSYFHDVGVESIESPNGCISSSSPVVFTIKNNGQYAETGFVAHVEIDDGASIVYSNDLVVGDLIQPCEMQTLTFPDVIFDGSGEYNVTACTQLGVDTNPINDCLTILFNVDLTQPDLVIQDESSGSIEIGDDIYESSNWSAVSQIGKWFIHVPIGNYHIYYFRLELQNDGTDTLTSYTIKTELLNGILLISGLLYFGSSGLILFMPIPGTAINGRSVSPQSSTLLHILVFTSGSFSLGVNVKSNCNEDSVILTP